MKHLLRLRELCGLSVYYMEETIQDGKFHLTFLPGQLGEGSFFLCDYNYNKMNLKSFPPFYKEMLKVWQGVDKCRHFEENKKNPIIFNNRHICIRNKMIFDEELLKKGIVQINDIVEGIRMKPYSYFWNLGIESKGLLKFMICLKLFQMIRK